MGCGHRGAGVEGVGIITLHRQPGVERRQDVVGRRGRTGSAWCRDTHPGSEVGVAGKRARGGCGADRNDPSAARRLEVRYGTPGVARRNNDRRAVGKRDVDGILEHRCATAATSEAHVDDFRRVLVGRHAWHASAGRPDHRVGDIGQRATAFAQRAYVLDLGVERHAGDTDIVVGGRRHRPGNMGTVPAAVIRNTEDVALACVPVALVVGIVIPAIAVAGGRDIRDEVVAGDGLAHELLVRSRAGIEHRDHDAVARRLVPRRLEIDAAGAVLVMPGLLRVERIVGNQRPLEPAVGLHCTDRWIFHEFQHQPLGVGAIEPAVGRDEACAGSEFASRFDLDPNDLRRGSDALRVRCRTRLAALVVADDEAVERVLPSHLADVDRRTALGAGARLAGGIGKRCGDHGGRDRNRQGGGFSVASYHVDLSPRGNAGRCNRAGRCPPTGDAADWMRCRPRSAAVARGGRDERMDGGAVGARTLGRCQQSSIDAMGSHAGGAGEGTPTEGRSGIQDTVPVVAGLAVHPDPRSRTGCSRNSSLGCRSSPDPKPSTQSIATHPLAEQAFNAISLRPAVAVHGAPSRSLYDKSDGALAWDYFVCPWRLAWPGRWRTC